MGVIDHQFPEAGSRQPLNVVFDKGFTRNGYEGFWLVIGKGAHALATASSENHGFHLAGINTRALDQPPRFEAVRTAPKSTETASKELACGLCHTTFYRFIASKNSSLVFETFSLS
jgi:hypothetical protein